MKLASIHFLLSYRCTDECDHCFLWGSPKAKGTMTLAQIRDVLLQAKDLGTVRTVYFEGGEPFLFYPVLIQALREATALGFGTGIVSNCYWATSGEDSRISSGPNRRLTTNAVTTAPMDLKLR